MPKTSLSRRITFKLPFSCKLRSNVNTMGMCLPFSDVFILLNARFPASMTSDDYLAKRIEPVEQQPLENSCLEGTRVNILREATDWVQDSTSLKEHFVDCGCAWRRKINNCDHDSQGTRRYGALLALLSSANAMSRNFESHVRSGERLPTASQSNTMV